MARWGLHLLILFLGVALLAPYASADDALPAGTSLEPGDPAELTAHAGETVVFRWAISRTSFGSVPLATEVTPPPDGWRVTAELSAPTLPSGSIRFVWVNVTVPSSPAPEPVAFEVNLTVGTGHTHLRPVVVPVLEESETEQVFLQLTILLTVAVASHFVIKRFRQPTIIGEIAIGIVLGPSIIGFVLAGWQPPSPDAVGFFDEQIIAVFAGLGAIFLLFLIGLEADIRAIYARKNIYVAVGGVVLPWVGGFAVAFFMVPDANLLTDRFAMAAFVGATLVATSTAIAAAILLELGMMRTEVASTIMGAVIVDDILGLLVLSISLGVAGGSVDIFSLLLLLGIAVAFIVGVMVIGTRYFTRLVVWTQAAGLRIGLKHAGFMVAMAVALFISFLSEVIGLSAVIGAFLAGAMFSNTPLSRDFEEGVSILGAVFTPIFFISLGLLVNVWAVNVSLIVFGVVLLVVAFVTKYFGCGFPARRMGMTRLESAAVGYGMTPRGEVGLIIALVAQQQGVIGPDLFSIVVMVMIVVSVLPAPFLRKTLLAMRSAGEVEASPVRLPPEGPL